jgi:hypothetical protein
MLLKKKIGWYLKVLLHYLSILLALIKVLIKKFYKYSRSGV